jgi:hypothetical protein
MFYGNPTDTECIYAAAGSIPGWTDFSINGHISRPTTASLQCCGTIANVAICPSTASTIGILSGYLSLWYSIVQALFGIVLALQRAKARASASAADNSPPASECALELTAVGGSEANESVSAAT